MCHRSHNCRLLIVNRPRKSVAIDAHAHGFFSEEEFAEVEHVQNKLKVVLWYPERFDWTQTDGLFIVIIGMRL